MDIKKIEREIKTLKIILGYYKEIQKSSPNISTWDLAFKCDSILNEWRGEMIWMDGIRKIAYFLKKYDNQKISKADHGLKNLIKTESKENIQRISKQIKYLEFKKQKLTAD